MKYHGDFAPAKTVRIEFNTRDTNNTPITLGGTPVCSVYKDANTTESVAGVTLSVDFDSRTGFHLVTIDTSADGTFYSAGSDFKVVITTGTVAGVSVVGVCVGTFSLYNRSALRPATADRTLVVDAAGLADANVVKVGPTGAGTAQTAADLYTQELRILDRIDYQRGQHTVAGSTFYVDGTAGNDANAGTRAAPKKTISAALALCTSNAHDEIILLPDAGGGPTTITETATISVAKNYVQIRGPGRDVLVTQTAGASRDVFSITASGVGLSGFRIATNGNASNGVTVARAADFVLLDRLWIENVTQDAVQFNVANRCQVSNCVIVAAGRDGVRVTSGAGTGDYNIVVDSVIRQCVGSAVNLQGSDASDCRIQRNVIRDNAVGVTIAAGVLRTSVTDNRFVSNTTQIADAGTATLQMWNFFGTDTTGSITGDVQGKVLGGGASALSGVGVQADMEQVAGASLATHAAGMVPADVRDIVGRAVTDPGAGVAIGTNVAQVGSNMGTSSGVTGDVAGKVIGGGVSALSGVGVQADVEQWRGSVPNALVSGDLPADVKQWLGAAPAILTTSGYLQVTLLRWLTDNAAGTPDALSSGKLPADLKLWLAAAPLALSSQLVQAIVNSYAAGEDPATLVLATPANKLATDGTGRVTVGSNADKTGYSLTAGEETAIANAVNSAVIEGTITRIQAERIMLSAMAGKSSGHLTNTPKYRDTQDTKDRIDATTTADGRTSVTLDGT